MDAKKIEEITEAVADLTEKVKALSEKQNAQFTDLMMEIRKISDKQAEESNERETSNRTDEELFNEAKELVIKQRRASSSLIQRRLSIGYAKAAEIMDRLETEGIIGPGDGAKPRAVLVE